VGGGYVRQAPAPSVSLIAVRREHPEAGGGTMATFTDWMRLGEARMTPFATLALGAS